MAIKKLKSQKAFKEAIFGALIKGQPETISF